MSGFMFLKIAAITAGGSALLFNILPERPQSFKHRIKHCIGTNHGFYESYRGTDNKHYDGRVCAICHQWKKELKSQPDLAADFTLSPARISVFEQHATYASTWGLKSHSRYVRWLKSHPHLRCNSQAQQVWAEKEASKLV